MLNRQRYSKYELEVILSKIRYSESGQKLIKEFNDCFTGVITIEKLSHSQQLRVILLTLLFGEYSNFELANLKSDLEITECPITIAHLVLELTEEKLVCASMMVLWLLENPRKVKILYEVGNTYLSLTKQSRQEVLVKHLNILAEADVGEAQLALARLLLVGNEPLIQKDIPKAIELYNQSINAGYCNAALDLNDIYRYKEQFHINCDILMDIFQQLVQRDITHLRTYIPYSLEKAVDALERACLLKAPPHLISFNDYCKEKAACARLLAKLYIKNSSLGTPDFRRKKIVDYYEMASLLNNAKATAELGALYLGGNDDIELKANLSLAKKIFYRNYDQSRPYKLEYNKDAIAKISRLDKDILSEYLYWFLLWLRLAENVYWIKELNLYSQLTFLLRNGHCVHHPHVKQLAETNVELANLWGADKKPLLNQLVLLTYQHYGIECPFIMPQQEDKLFYDSDLKEKTQTYEAYQATVKDYAKQIETAKPKQFYPSEIIASDSNYQITLSLSKRIFRNMASYSLKDILAYQQNISATLGSLQEKVASNEIAIHQCYELNRQQSQYELTQQQQEDVSHLYAENRQLEDKMKQLKSGYLYHLYCEPDVVLSTLIKNIMACIEEVFEQIIPSINLRIAYTEIQKYVALIKNQLPKSVHSETDRELYRRTYYQACGFIWYMLNMVDNDNDYIFANKLMKIIRLQQIDPVDAIYAFDQQFMKMNTASKNLFRMHEYKRALDQYHRRELSSARHLNSIHGLFSDNNKSNRPSSCLCNYSASTTEIIVPARK